MYLSLVYGFILSWLILLGKDVSSVDVVNRDGGKPKEFHADPGKNEVYAKAPKNVVSMNEFDENGFSPLMRAATFGNLDALKSYIDAGAKVNLANAKGDTAIFSSAKNGFYLSTAELIKHGAKINVANKNGVTPLLIAIMGGYHEVTQLLLDNGADPEIALPNGVTALMIAAQKGLLKILHLLLTYNVKMNTQTKDGGTTALMFACTSSHLPTVQLLLGTLPTQQIPKLNVALPKARMNMKREALNVNIQDQDGMTAIAIASYRGHAEIVHELLEVKADMNIKDSLGRLPIHHAIEGSHETIIIDWLIEYGSEIPQSGFYRNPDAMVRRENRLRVVVDL